MNTYRMMEWADAYDVPRRTLAVQAWTDYPFIEMGDKAGEKAPVRKCWVLAYDDGSYSYVNVCVETAEGGTLYSTVKRGYVYRQPGRCGEVKILSRWKIRNARNQPAWQFLRRRYTKTSYHFYHDDNRPITRFSTRAALIRKVNNTGWQGEAWFWRESHHSNGGSFSEHDMFGNTTPTKRSLCSRIKKRSKGRK